MKWTRMLALAVLAVAVVVIGPGTASSEDETEDPEIVLCKHAALELCAAGETWGIGKSIVGKVEDLKFLGVLSLLCKKTELAGKVSNAMGPSLWWEIEFASISECEKECKVTVEQPGTVEFTVAQGDRYHLLFKLKVKAVCPLGITCVYEGHSSLELQETNTTGMPTTKAVDEPLTVSGSKLCGTAAKWDSPEIILKSTANLPILLSLFDLEEG